MSVRKPLEQNKEKTYFFDKRNGEFSMLYSKKDVEKYMTCANLSDCKSLMAPTFLSSGVLKLQEWNDSSSFTKMTWNDSGTPRTQIKKTAGPTQITESYGYG